MAREQIQYQAAAAEAAGAALGASKQIGTAEELGLVETCWNPGFKIEREPPLHTFAVACCSYPLPIVSRMYLPCWVVVSFSKASRAIICSNYTVSPDGCASTFVCNHAFCIS